ncbi:uncharacterized protein LOC126184221 [Schistocerca cancellata]|uniref:uncharacterized protein LOC126184221 n=1 Tax=Schistocerca cancellata TaxID=274614 RepID=UPI0021192FDD|nr:uncharacterized protein LOC126184221 [Schistocerca cancellata]
MDFEGSDSSDDFSESVEQLRSRLNIVKRLMENNTQKRSKKRRSARDSIIDGSFLSVVFAVVLVMIICVSVYAFANLYYAILRKFQTKQHTEL